MKENFDLTKNEIPDDKQEINEEKKINKLKLVKSKLVEKLDTVENAKRKRDISLFLQRYTRVAVYGFVVALMLIVCAVSLVSRRTDDEGTMVSMTELAAETKPFAGKSFDAEILTYDDMLQISEENGTYELSDADKTRVEQILATLGSTGTQNKSQSVTLDEHEVVQEVETTTEEATVSVVTTVTADTSSLVTNPTYATADGTYEYLGEYILTAYCPCPICCGAWSDVVNPTTASGTRATANRTVAVDTSVIPFGTQLLINGQVYIAEDRGSAINGNHIDIFFSTHQEAVNWGKQTGSVYKKISN